MNAANSVIEKLLQLKKAQAAMVLDALFITDAIKLQSIEIQSILHYFKLSGIAIGESIVRRGLFQLAELGLFSTSKKMNRRKGRPIWHYTPKTIQKIAEKLGVKLHRNENADSIPLTAFDSTANFRAAKHYSLLVRLGKSELSRKKLGARLGVGGRSTYNYELGKKLTVTHRTDSKRLYLDDIESAPIIRGKGNVFLEVFFERELTVEELANKYGEFDLNQVVLKREFTRTSRYMPYTKFILERELGRGHEVYKVWQITNEYLVK
jgi:predicted transcriptional regulator